VVLRSEVGRETFLQQPSLGRVAAVALQHDLAALEGREIVLQGDRRDTAKAWLLKEGFTTNL